MRYIIDSWQWEKMPFAAAIEITTKESYIISGVKQLARPRFRAYKRQCDALCAMARGIEKEREELRGQLEKVLNEIKKTKAENE